MDLIGTVGQYQPCCPEPERTDVQRLDFMLRLVPETPGEVESDRHIVQPTTGSGAVPCRSAASARPTADAGESPECAPWAQNREVK